jgi:YHS domain-containing protein
MYEFSTGRLAGALALSVFITGPVAAQEAAPAHQHPAPADPAEAQHVHPAGAPAGLFAPREASGTAWLPDVTPMFGLHQQRGTWEVMLHGNAFVQFLHEEAPEHRGATQAGSINWGMVMARRPAGNGRVGVRGMFSLEPWTIGGCGYPNLLATGEFCDGDGIHDKQHPHDLFMEIAAEYDRPLTGNLRWEIYGGPAGEPALGPAGFPHRLSAMSNPLSPITHHWLDATHITYGVVTTGVYAPRWKVEGSLFNGREPDERRWDFDFAPLDSVSARVSVAPSPNLVVQVSAGHLNEAEPSHTAAPAIDVDRTTASATYHRPVGGGGLFAGTLAWGANREAGETTHGLVAEWSVAVSDRHTWFGRAELNGKPAHDLDIHESNDVFTVGKLQGGYTHYLPARRGFTPGIGGTLSASVVPEALRPRYGGVGVGVGFFLTVRPTAHQMASAAVPAATTDPHAGHIMPAPSPPPATAGAAPAASPARAPAAPGTATDADRPTPAEPRLPVVAAERVIDPACAATIDLLSAPRATYQGKVYYFCSTADRDEFVKDPEVYVKRGAR